MFIALFAFFTFVAFAFIAVAAFPFIPFMGVDGRGVEGRAGPGGDRRAVREAGERQPKGCGSARAHRP